jgi:hypothetical protein
MKHVYNIFSRKKYRISPNPCKATGVLTVHDGGRLGNLMSQYATLFASAQILGVEAVISKHMSTILAKVFPNLSLPPMRSEKDKCHWNWTYVDITNLTLESFGLDRKRNVFIGGFPAALPTFDPYRKSLSLSADFKMDFGLTMGAKMYLRKVAKTIRADVFVGRKADIISKLMWIIFFINPKAKICPPKIIGVRTQVLTLQLHGIALSFGFLKNLSKFFWLLDCSRFSRMII